MQWKRRRLLEEAKNEMTYLFSLWLALAAVIAAMALYRKRVSADEDDAIHLTAGTERLVQHQEEVAGRLSTIDKWGKTLTALEVVFGLALAGIWLYQAWLDGAKIQ
jgi:hypothetical protein